MYFLFLHFSFFFFFFFFNDTATTEIYTLSLHDALPIYGIITVTTFLGPSASAAKQATTAESIPPLKPKRSEEHTSELQSQFHLVCRLLLEKKKKKTTIKKISNNTHTNNTILLHSNQQHL